MDVLPLRTDDPAPAKTNFAGFDLIRALAALGVVLLHSGVPYLQHPMPGLAWPVRDASSSWVDFGFWWVELFIMPLFLVMAGFLAWQTLHRRGALNLIASRAKRLLKPFLFGVLIILPLDLYSWVLGWVAEGVVAPVKLKSLKFDGIIDRDLWGFSHLWFLNYLFLYVVAVAVAVSARDRFTKRFQLGPQVATMVLLVAGSLVLYFRPEVVWGFQHSFLPVASKWIYSGIFFALGAVLAQHDGQLTWLKSSASRMLAPAAMFSIAAVVLGRWQLAGGSDQLAQMTLAVLTCSGAVLLTLSIIGIAVKRVDHVSNTVGYLAAASFWVYLVHHPLVGLVHTDLKWLLPGANPILKTILAFTLTSGVCLLSYEGLVRRTSLGRWLGFTWQPSSPIEDGDAVISIDPSRRGRAASGPSSPRETRKAA